jgi:hypothetical protein
MARRPNSVRELGKAVARRARNNSHKHKGWTMLGKIAGAIIGNRIAGRNDGVKGALLGAAGARLATRGLGPLGTALAVGYGAKKLYDWNRARKTNPRFPNEATPAQRSVRTHGV